MYTNNFLWLCIGIMSRAAVQTAGHCQCMLEHVCGWGFSNNTFSFDFIYLSKCSNKMTFILHIHFVSCLCVADRPTVRRNERTDDRPFISFACSLARTAFVCKRIPFSLASSSGYSTYVVCCLTRWELKNSRSEQFNHSLLFFILSSFSSSSPLS